MILQIIFLKTAYTNTQLFCEFFRHADVESDLKV